MAREDGRVEGVETKGSGPKSWGTPPVQDGEGEIVSNVGSELRNLRSRDREQKDVGTCLQRKQLGLSYLFSLILQFSAEANFLPGCFLKEPALRALLCLRELKLPKHCMHYGLQSTQQALE